VSAGVGSPSGDAHAAAWQQEDTVASFAERRRVLIPLLDLQEDVLAKALTRGARPVKRFLDLGAGAGAVSELVLGLGGENAGSQGVLVDFSEPMLERAGANLAPFEGRWKIVRGDLSSPDWQAGLPEGRYDAIVSGLAIHHLSSARKRDLFAEAFALLEPGGTFVNMDCVAVEGPLEGLFDEYMLANAVANEHEHGRDGSDQDVDFDTGEDQLDSIEDQLRWLRDADFQHVEAHFKWAEAAVFGGVKPVKGDE
jgi:tRNA (cmo5U34)-methyltransferase